MKLLDQAQQAASDYSPVYQYRSNVAFLMGDRAAAMVAVEKTLALEPDNPLFKRNLKHLKAASAPKPAAAKS
ncbi:MAG: hypothetical protein P8R42_27455 [Candidatus Binatia bacterium]|nr:hypothetical protein [Candidatus Binatia bacterium]